MLHPFMTAELVRQRRAALDAESRNQRLGRQLQPQLAPIPSAAGSPSRHGRPRATSAPWWPAPPEPADYRDCHDNPP
jgi:hypothetical protein